MCVLVLSGLEFIFFQVNGIEMTFGFRIKSVDNKLMF